jgi:Ser/Thr protein kinase RdoA (MazF antagonist)
MMENIFSYISESYGIQVLDAQKIEKGVLNSNFLIQTAGCQYVFKVYNFKKENEIDFEVRALKILGEENFPAPRIIGNNQGNFVGYFDSRPCILYYFIDGVAKDVWGVDLVRQVGVLIGKMHLILRDYTNRSKVGLWDFEQIKNLVQNDGARLVRGGFPGASALLSFLSREFDKINLEAGLPVGFTHQDVKPENVIVADGRVNGFVDFDNSYIGVLINDLTTTAIWSCFSNKKLDIDLFDTLVSGYEKERRLERCEKNSLEACMRFRFLREAFIGPYVTLHRMEFSKQRSDYFVELYKNFKGL